MNSMTTESKWNYVECNTWKCANCGHISKLNTPYCPICGHSMKNGTLPNNNEEEYFVTVISVKE